MKQHPIVQLDTLRNEAVRISDKSIAQANQILGDFRGKRFHLHLAMDPGDAGEVGIKLRTGAGEETLVGWSRVKSGVFVDRSRSGNTGFHENFSGRHAAPLTPKDGKVALRIVVDDCSVEVFADNGAVVLTDLIFPSIHSQGIGFFGEGGGAKILSAEIHRLEGR